jgi:hypothetical protein
VIGLPIFFAVMAIVRRERVSDMNEKIAEAGAVSWAVWSSACNSCRYLPQCESDDSFRFPNDAPCMKIKAEMLKGADHDR